MSPTLGYAMHTWWGCLPIRQPGSCINTPVVQPSSWLLWAVGLWVWVLSVPGNQELLRAVALFVAMSVLARKVLHQQGAPQLNEWGSGPKRG